MGYTSKKYLCHCTSGFTGENCETGKNTHIGHLKNIKPQFENIMVFFAVAYIMPLFRIGLLKISLFWQNRNTHCL